MMSDADIAAAIADEEARQASICDASANICTMGMTVLARTHRGEDVAILEHERVGFVRATKAPSRLVEVALVERRDAPRCYVPVEAIAGVA